MKSCRGLQFTERDKEIFQFMFENRMATTMDIMHRFFNQNARRNVIRRLKKYKKAGLVGMDSSPDLKQIYFYFLKNAGIKKLYPEAEFLDGNRPKSSNHVHDSTLMEVRNIFSESRMTHEYYTENMLMANDTLEYKPSNMFSGDDDVRLDAIFVMKADKRVMLNAVELELSEKSRNRYIDLIQRYYLNQKIPYVIFISATKNIEKKVMALENKLYPKGNTKFYYGNLKDFKKKKLPFIFKSCRGIPFEVF